MNLKNFIIIIFLLFTQFSSANGTNFPDLPNYFYEFQKNRYLYKFSHGNVQNIDFYFLANELSNKSQKQKSDSTRIKWEYLGPFIGTTLIANAAAYYIFKDAYWNESRTKFHTFNDWNNADMNIDKIGHIYAGMLLSKASYKVFKMTNVPEKGSIIFSSLSSIVFQTQVEIHDAYFEKWGWSWWDFGGNILGAIYPHLQNYFKPLQIINLKWSYHPSPAYKKGWYDYWIKDYEGFTYYLTFDINSILPEKFDKIWPDWLNLAVAYGVEKVKLGKNIWNSTDRPLGDREWYIALDYSLLKLFNPNSKLLRELLDILDYLHFPAPAVRISPSVIWYGIYF